MLIVLGGALMFWGMAASAPAIIPTETEETLTLTGTPADLFASREIIYYDIFVVKF